MQHTPIGKPLSRIFLLAAACLLAIPFLETPLRAQERDTLLILYPKGQTAVLPDFRDNARRIEELKTRMDGAYKSPATPRIDRITVRSSASPEGSAALNSRIAEGRAENLAAYLRDHLGYPVGETSTLDCGIDWFTLGDLVLQDRNVPSRREVLLAVDEEDVRKIEQLDGGKAWDYLMKNIFPYLRKSLVIIEHSPSVAVEPTRPLNPDAVKKDPDVRKDPPQDTPPSDSPREEKTVTEVRTETLPTNPATMFIPDVEERENGAWSIKTNILPWFMLVANAAVEVDFGNHFSLSIPIYYSGANWFSSEMKFRILGSQPEVRYFMRDDFKGFFLGAHATFGWYNIALKGGDYRYQDKSMNSPAFGGGLDVGYKLPIGLDERLGLEFSLGAGYLNLDYDKFFNVPNGRLAGSGHKDYFGIDNAAVGLYYRFPYNKERRSDK